MDYRIDELSRFRLLLAGLTASLALSAFYGFNLISGHLEVTYGFDANDLTIITTCGIVVGFLTFPAGILLDYAGPMYVLISTSVSALGALLFGLSFGGFITGSVVRFSIFCALLNFGCTWFDSGSLMTVLGSFLLTRGLVVALMKTLAGLGASLLAMINYGFFREKYAAYMYFIAIYLTIFGAVSIALIRFPPYHIVDLEKKTLLLEIQERRRLIEPFYLKQYPPMRRFFLGCAIILTMIIYLTAQSLSVAFLPSIGDQSRLGLTIGVFILTCSLVFIAAPFPFLGGMSHTPNEELPPLPSNEADAEDKLQGGNSELVEEDENE